LVKKQQEQILDDRGHVYQDLAAAELNDDQPITLLIMSFDQSIDLIYTNLSASSANDILSVAKSSSLL
jgi:hypothetical protein